MTVMKKIDEELKALNMEDQGKEPEPAGDADFEAAIEKAVNRRIKKGHRKSRKQAHKEDSL